MFADLRVPVFAHILSVCAFLASTATVAPPQDTKTLLSVPGKATHAVLHGCSSVSSNGAPARAETDAAVYSSTSAEKKPRFAPATMR